MIGWEQRGRAPKRGDTQHEDPIRNTSWFYRVRVKVPPDSIRSLATEYARHVGRDTDARAVIKNGIRRAEHFLACLDVPDPPLAK